MSHEPLRIAIMGTRGVPAAYGGFETFTEELGARLVARGHDVTVYGRSHVIPADLHEHRGMRLRIFPTIRHKYLDTVAHTGLSVLDGLIRRFDVVLICNNANAPFALVPRLGAHPLPGLALRSLTPAIERRIFVAARSGSDDHPLIRAVLAAIAG